MAVTKQVSVKDLGVGMYVAELDRPWLETPFLFQGFYIRDADEIKELQSHCKSVFVTSESLPADFEPSTASNDSDAGASDAADDGKPSLDLRTQRRDEDKQEEPDFEQTNVVYEEKTSLKEEFGTASRAHQEALSSLQQVMQSLRKSGELEIGPLEAAVSPMVDSVLRNPAALSCLMRMQKKDHYLYQHSLASSVWAAVLGRQIGLPRTEINLLSFGAMLLDVGKTRIPMDILTKPGDLTEKENALMRRHVQFGIDILNKAGGVDARVVDMVAHHHERYNGTGYPLGVSGNSIPVFGRIAAIVDAYDAMITPRPYAKLQSSYDALRKLRVLADVEFQAEIVNQFTRAIGAFPTGTLIELNTGDIGIVTRQNQIRRLRPEIMVIMDANKQLLPDFRVIDLGEETTTEEGGGQSLYIECGLPPGAHGIDPTEYYID